MICVGGYPSGRVDDKWWSIVEGVAGIAADCLAASLQVCTMADEAVSESGSSQGIRGMRLYPSQRVRCIIDGSTGISVGTSCQGQEQER